MLNQNDFVRGFFQGVVSMFFLSAALQRGGWAWLFVVVIAYMIWDDYRAWQSTRKREEASQWRRQMGPFDPK